MTRTLAVRVVLAAALAALFIFFAFRMVRPDGEALLLAFSRVHWGWVLVFLLVTILSQSTRTIRWAVLLRPLGPVTWKRLIPISLVGYLASFTLPALGELVRPYLIRGKAGVSGSAALATVMIERILDGLLVSLLAFVALLPLRSRNDAPWIDAVCFGTLAAFLGALLWILLLHWKRAWALNTADRMLRPLSVRLAKVVTEKMQSFVQALGLLPDRRIVARVVFWTSLYWALNALGVHILARSFDIVLTAQAVWAVIGVIVVGFFIPTPGQVGTYHFFFLLALGLFVPEEVLRGAGAALAVFSHALQVLVFLTLGGLALFSPEVRWWRKAVPAAAVLLALLVPQTAWAKSSKSIAASQEAIWSAAVRYIRVDRNYLIRDKDKDAGYVLFDWVTGNKKHSAALEIWRGEAKGTSVVQLRCEDLPRYEELHFLDRLEQKVREEGGPKEPDPPEKKQP